MILARVNKMISLSIENLRLNQNKNKNVEKKKDSYKEYINPDYNEKEVLTQL